ncbi:MAG: DUF1778 domain-containing protein [Dehalococcoidia bacterium]
MPAAMKTERLEARVTPDQKTLIQRAAELRGRSLTDFVVESAQAAAEETLRAQQILLSARDSALFAQAILEPAEPSATLKAAARRYRAFVSE